MTFLHLVHSLYSAMWSNIWAPSIWTLFGVGLAHWHSMHKQGKIKEEHGNRLDEITQRVDSLIDKLIPGDDND